MNLLPVQRAGELSTTGPQTQWLVQDLWTDQAVGILDNIQKTLFDRACQYRDENIKDFDTFEDFNDLSIALDRKSGACSSRSYCLLVSFGSDTTL